MELVYRNLEGLKPHPDNPKEHDLPAIIASIERFGFVEPIIVDTRTGLTLSGHGRTEALRTLQTSGGDAPRGIRFSPAPQRRWMIPVIEVESADDKHAKALLVALNRTVELGGWNQAALAEILETIADTDDGELLIATGYGSDDLSRLLADLAEPQFPVVPPEDQPRLDERTPDPITCPNCQHTWDRRNPGDAE